MRERAREKRVVGGPPRLDLSTHNRKRKGNYTRWNDLTRTCPLVMLDGTWLYLDRRAKQGLSFLSPEL